MMQRISWPAALVFAISFVLYYNGILNCFYEIGATSDPSWFSALLWRAGPELINPAFINDDNWLGMHFTPIFYIPAILSHLLIFDPIQWLAICFASMHAFASASVAWVSRRVAVRLDANRAWSDTGAALIGLTFALCGLQAVFLWLPHYEIAIPALLVATCAALALQRPLASWVFFVVLLGVREDAGLHLATFLAPLIVITLWREKRVLRRELLFVALAIAYSVAASMAMRQLFPGGGELFQAHYIGDPPFAHVTWDELSKRFNILFWQTGRVWAPLAVIAAYSLLRRDIEMLIGAVAVMPYLVIQVALARHGAAWELAHYYTFPVLFSLAWPTILALYRSGPAALRGSVRDWPWLPLAVIAAAYVPPMNSKLPFYGSNYRDLSFFVQQGTLSADKYRSFAVIMSIGRPELGRLAAVEAALSFAPRVIRNNEWFRAWKPGDSIKPENVDTLLIFDGIRPCPDVNALAAAANLQHTFQVPGTRIVVATRRSLSELPTFRPLLAPYYKRAGWFCNRRRLW